MLDDGLAASERSRYGCYAALGDREECVNDTLSGDQRFYRRQLRLVRTSAPNRPFLHHCKLFFAVFRLNDRYSFLHRKFTALDLFDGTFYTIRHHNLMLNDQRLLHGTDDVACFHAVARFHGRHKLPFLITL